MKLPEAGIVIPEPKLWVTLTIRDAGGRIISKRKERGHSWVRNYYVCIICHAGFVPYREDLGLGIRNHLGVWNYSNTDCAYIKSLDDFVADAGAYHGIAIGTGTTPPSSDDYYLEARIDHGEGPGQMLYQASTRSHETIAGGWRSVFQRNFNNNSGDTITVTETGLIYRLLAERGGHYLMARNVHDPGAEVPHGGVLTVTYTVEVEYTIP